MRRAVRVGGLVALLVGAAVITALPWQRSNQNGSDPSVRREQIARHLGDVRRIVDSYLAAKQVVDTAEEGTPAYADALEEMKRASFWLILQFPQLRDLRDPARQVVVVDAERLRGLVADLERQHLAEAGAGVGSQLPTSSP